MTKLQNLSLFSKNDLYSSRYLLFLETELGKLYQAIPFEELAKLFPKKKTKVGAKSWLSPEGMFGLMFLKHYTQLSDRKLIEQLNTNWAMQYFCNIQLGINEMIKDKDLPSRVRGFIANNIEWENIQEVLLKEWKGDIKNQHIQMNDATVYESYAKYPTDVKLLWDSTVWVYETMHALYKRLGLRKPRSKYSEQQVRQMAYNKKRKKPYKITKQRKKALLYLLNKGINLLDAGLDLLSDENILPEKEALLVKLQIIKEVYRQQQYMFDNEVNKIKDRIVSLFKPYLRPMVRGKERNKIELGAKLVIAQVDGINLIDKLSFDPFNEAKELKNINENHEKRFGKLELIGIDRIYGTNENRKYMSEQGIFSSLVRKGRAAKDEKDKKELRSKLGKERSTVLEGSFGNEKNHYSLRKVKARNEYTEVIWIFFGIMTANAVKISKRRTLKKLKSGKEPEQLKIAS